MALAGDQGPARVSILDNRLSVRPETFGGDESKFVAWAFVFSMYVEGVIPELATPMKRAARAEEMTSFDVLTAPQQALSRQLMVLLTMLCKGKALRILANVTSGHGLEGWRQLHLQLAAGGPARAMGLLLRIMEAKFSGESGAIDQLNAWEALVRLHDQEADVGEEVPDKIKQAVILRAALRG